MPFRAADNVKKQFPQFEAIESYSSLMALIKFALSRGSKVRGKDLLSPTGCWLRGSLGSLQGLALFKM